MHGARSGLGTRDHQRSCYLTNAAADKGLLIVALRAHSYLIPLQQSSGVRRNTRFHVGSHS
jgi:hypothetical protein